MKVDTERRMIIAEYIDRESLIKRFCERRNEEMSESPCEPSDCFAREVIKTFPAADVVPVRHGRWIDAYPDIEPNPMFMYGICSECGFEQGISKYLNYCPNCGAKMDGDSNV